MYDMPPGFRPEERFDDNGDPVTFAVDVKEEERRRERDKVADQHMRAFDLYVSLSLAVENWKDRALMDLAAWVAADEPESSHFELLKKIKKMADGHDFDLYVGVTKLLGRGE